MTYKELKAYFDETELPMWLRGETKVYFKIKNQAKLWFEQIDAEIKRVGIDNLRDHSPKAIHAGRCVKQLYRDLQVRENWDKGLYTAEEINGEITK